MFSAVKKFRNRPGFMFPDRGQVTMTAPFLRAYALELVRACHRREAHAIGGMAAFIPSRRDPEVNATALAKVREDKERRPETASTAPGSRTPISCRWRARSSTPASARGRTRRRSGATPPRWRRER